MSVPIVFDEWIFEELAGRGHNGKKDQEETFDLLVKIYRSADKIVMLEDSPFVQKWVDFYGDAQKDLNQRTMSTYLAQTIFYNDQKIYALKQADLKPIPSDLAKLVPLSDQYLIQAYLKIKNKKGFVVTTDGKWNHKQLIKKSMDIRMRDAFIKQYLS